MSDIPSYGAERLRQTLRLVAQTQKVADALGIADTASQPEEFWVAQRRAARHRFLQLCLQELGWDPSWDLEDLSEERCELVADKADALLALPDFDYALVRRWFHARGQFQYNKALHLAKERRYLADSCLRVLAVLEVGGAKFLAFGPGIEEVRLVAESDATEFPLVSASELTKEHRAELATHFSYLKERIGAKDIKVLQGARFERQ